MSNTLATGQRTSDFLVQVALGNISGYQAEFMIGVREAMDLTACFETIWDNDFDYTPFTEPLEMFISSSDTNDTMVIRVEGLDSNFDPKVTDTALTGLSQVSAGTFRHVQTARVLGTVTPAGDVYIAATDELTGGVPDTDSKVKSKIIRGKNITHNGFYMTPRGKMGATLAVRGSTGDASKPVVVQTWVHPFDGVPVNLVTYTVMAGFAQYSFPSPVSSFNAFDPLRIFRPEKTLVQYKGCSGGIGTMVFFAVDVLLVDYVLTGLAQ